MVVGNNHPFRYDAPSTYYAVIANFCAVEHHGVHADKGIVTNFAGVDNAAMTKCGVFTNNDGLTIGFMQNAVFLDVGFCANFDIVAISAQAGAMHDDCMIANANISYDPTGIRDICFGMDGGVAAILDSGCCCFNVFAVTFGNGVSGFTFKHVIPFVFCLNLLQ